MITSLQSGNNIISIAASDIVKECKGIKGFREELLKLIVYNSARMSRRYTLLDNLVYSVLIPVDIAAAIRRSLNIAGTSEIFKEINSIDGGENTQTKAMNLIKTAKHLTVNDIEAAYISVIGCNPNGRCGFLHLLFRHT